MAAKAEEPGKRPARTKTYMCVRCKHEINITNEEYEKLIEMLRRLENITQTNSEITTITLIEQTMYAARNRCCEEPMYNFKR